MGRKNQIYAKYIRILASPDVPNEIYLESQEEGSEAITETEEETEPEEEKEVFESAFWEVEGANFNVNWSL